jgi:hypothetical protein
VGDVTEMLNGGGKLYLAVILDLFSRMVVGWALSAANDRHLALRALEQALRRRCPEAGLLHHTDQGSPYASEDYQRMLAAHGITCSMSRRGNAHDNAAMTLIPGVAWIDVKGFLAARACLRPHLARLQQPRAEGVRMPAMRGAPPEDESYVEIDITVTMSVAV